MKLQLLLAFLTHSVLHTDAGVILRCNPVAASDAPTVSATGSDSMFLPANSMYGAPTAPVMTPSAPAAATQYVPISATDDAKPNEPTPGLVKDVSAPDAEEPAEDATLPPAKSDTTDTAKPADSEENPFTDAQPGAEETTPTSESPQTETEPTKGTDAEADDKPSGTTDGISSIMADPAKPTPSAGTALPGTSGSAEPLAPGKAEIPETATPGNKTPDNVTKADFGTFPAAPAGAQCKAHTEGPPPAVEIANLRWGKTDYNNERVKAASDSEFTISLNVKDNVSTDPQGSRIVSNMAYTRGRVSATITSGASVPGIVAAFYLSNDEPATNSFRSQDEVDFELMGARGASYVQTNYFTGGIGWKEQMHKIDHTSEVEYQMEWDIKTGATLTMTPKGGKPMVRKITLKPGESWRPMRVYLSFWGTKACDHQTDEQVLRWAGLPPQSAMSKTFEMKVTNFHIQGVAGEIVKSTAATPALMKNEAVGLKNLARTCIEAGAPLKPNTEY